jgi:hypothetical protein
MLSVSDWHILMVGSSGLLLVVPHLFAVRVSVLVMYSCEFKLKLV